MSGDPVPDPDPLEAEAEKLRDAVRAAGGDPDAPEWDHLQTRRQEASEAS
jgi:hypothetical protein